jgi:hypothetical protein
LRNWFDWKAAIDIWLPMAIAVAVVYLLTAAQAR